MGKVKIFTEGFLKEIGFTLVFEEPSKFAPHNIYGKAKGRIGLTHISWNEEGHSCTYFGDKLEPNTSITIYKDAETRKVFNGYVFTQDDVRKILSLTW